MTWPHLFSRGCAAGLAIMLTLNVAPAPAAVVVVPDFPTSFLIPNAAPFGGKWSQIRYQQVYDKSAFADPFVIESIAFFPGSDIDYQADVEIRLGLTDRPVFGLSTNLDSNISGSLATVFDDPSYTRTLSSHTPSLNFDLDAPFIFDPRRGQNLLLEVRVMDEVIDSFFGNIRSNSLSAPVTSRAYVQEGASTESDSGLITQFTGRVVPEPSSLALWNILSLAALPLVRVRRRR